MEAPLLLLQSPSKVLSGKKIGTLLNLNAVQKLIWFSSWLVSTFIFIVILDPIWSSGFISGAVVSIGKERNCRLNGPSETSVRDAHDAQHDKAIKQM